MPIRILVADGYPICRAGVRALLEREPLLAVVGEAGDGEAAVRLATELQPDIVLLEVGLPKLNGITTLQRIRAACPSVRGIFLSMYSSPRWVRRAFEAGAAAYFLKQADLPNLGALVFAVHQGLQLPPDAVTVGLPSPGAHHAPAKPAAKTLSPREAEILGLLSEGMTSKWIAAELGIRVRTVNTHINNMMKKFDVHTRAGLARRGLLDELNQSRPSGFDGIL